MKPLILFILSMFLMLLLCFFKNKEISENYEELSVLYSDFDGNLSDDVIIYPGTIMIWTGINPPPGWALCDGQNGRPNLQDRFIVGATYGTIPETDTRAGTSLNISSVGGSDKVTLTSRMIAHTHPVSSEFGIDSLQSDSNSHTHTATSTNLVGSESDLYYCGITGGCTKQDKFNGRGEWLDYAGGHSHDFQLKTGYTKNDVVTTRVNTLTKLNLPISILPPYYVLAFIIKL